MATMPKYEKSAEHTAHMILKLDPGMTFDLFLPRLTGLRPGGRFRTHGSLVDCPYRAGEMKGLDIRIFTLGVTP